MIFLKQVGASKMFPKKYFFLHSLRVFSSCITFFVLYFHQLFPVGVDAKVGGGLLFTLRGTIHQMLSKIGKPNLSIDTWSSVALASHRRISLYSHELKFVNSFLISAAAAAAATFAYPECLVNQVTPDDVAQVDSDRVLLCSVAALHHHLYTLRVQAEAGGDRLLALLEEYYLLRCIGGDLSSFNSSPVCMCSICLQCSTLFISNLANLSSFFPDAWDSPSSLFRCC
jgi:hypothetical protein